VFQEYHMIKNDIKRTIMQETMDNLSLLAIEMEKLIITIKKRK